VLWAKVVGHSIALADGLLSQARWHDVLRLADFLDNADETVVADSLRERTTPYAASTTRGSAAYTTRCRGRKRRRPSTRCGRFRRSSRSGNSRSR
jgi:hypothetical protein